MRRSEHYGELQKLVDDLFSRHDRITALDLVIRAESLDLHPDLLEICEIIPPGEYNRLKLCDQMNSTITAHGWGGKYGTVS